MNKSHKSIWNYPRRILLNWLGMNERSADANDDFFVGMNSAALRDRNQGNFLDIIEASLERWRDDPLARRIVNITTQFVIGRGLQISAASEAEDCVIQAFWQHPLNHMDARIQEWSDELCRTGNLFVLLSSDPVGMTYVRAIPAGQIDEIIPLDFDIEQALAFRLHQLSQPNRAVSIIEETIPAASLLLPCLDKCILHFAINRPVGGQWGEPDLAPLLPWLKLYSEWLIERARLNKYRNCFLYMVKAPNLSDVSRKQRQDALNFKPPANGSVLVVGRDEEWSVIAPQLESHEANEDGLTLKKMIAAGSGIPLQFLAEPGSGSRADSETVDGATCRNFEQRQRFIIWMVEIILRHVLARRQLVDHHLRQDVEISITGDDIRTVIPAAEQLTTEYSEQQTMGDE